MFLLALSLFSSLSRADMYLQGLRGSNNRLDDQNRDRNNANRLFDSQNNNRGGVNVGSTYFHPGSVAYFDWSNQHGCDNPNLNCEVIVQMTCQDRVRDGTSTQRIPTNMNDCAGQDCDTDVEYGRHESYASYMDCLSFSRNKGLYTANQNLNGDSARYTRQNPNGARNGYECPEERDYYPYWRPTEWMDVAIFTDSDERCEAYQAESQNVKDRYYCKVTEAYRYVMMSKNRRGFIPLDQTECESLEMPKLENGQIVMEGNNYVPAMTPAEGGGQMYGEWVAAPAWGIPAPVCKKTTYTRDNHLGHVEGGHYWFYNWTVPDVPSWPTMHEGEPNQFSPSANYDSCVMRFRYNISTKDFLGFENSSSVQAARGIDSTVSTYPANVNRQRDPAMVPIWETYQLSYEENEECFKAVNSNNGNDEGRRGCREYVMQNNPKVDIFGSLLMDTYNGADKEKLMGTVKFQLAINTAQFGRTFQDRTHTFGIHSIPENDECAGKPIHNVQVSGKRGNIVQTYPAHEYDYNPEWLDVQEGDCVHFQWTGSNTNPNNNAGQGRQGSDRSNIVLIRPPHFEEGQSENYRQTGLAQYGQLGKNYPAFISEFYRDGTTRNPLAMKGTWDESSKVETFSPLDRANFLGFSFDDLEYLALGGGYGGELSELDESPSYVDLGPKVVRGGTGAYHYMSTRNNNFSNRSQKGVIFVRNSVTSMIEVSPALGGMLQIGSNNWLQVPVGALERLTQITITAVPFKTIAENSFKKKPASDFLFVNPTDMPLNPGKTLSLSIEYTPRGLSKPHIYRANTLTGDWEEVETEQVASNMAQAEISAGGVYVVADQTRAGLVVLIIFIVFAVLAMIAYGLWRKYTIRGANFEAQKNSARPQATATPLGAGIPQSTSTTNVGGTAIHETLPQGWQRIDDPKSLRTYYINTKTGESQYELPVAAA